MKTSCYRLVALVSGAALLSPVTAVEYTAGSCADMEDIDDTTITSLVVTSSNIDCDSYLRLRVRNTMTLSATVPEVTFSNFAMKVFGSLTVGPDVTFTGVEDAEKYGGVLNVRVGAFATFMGTASFIENSIMETELPNIPSEGGGYFEDGILRKGGAIHNKGTLVFEKDATFVKNEERTQSSTRRGLGGAISNAMEGSITFKAGLVMDDNNAEGFFEGDGGGIYNRGAIVVEGESLFTENTASDGGAIYQESGASITFNSFANFTDNTCFDLRGAAIGNFGGVVTFNAGSLFFSNHADGSGDGGLGGAVYNGDAGDITWFGLTTFRDNSAYYGGAIYTEETATLTFPAAEEDLIFENNQADNDLNCNDVAYGFDSCGP